MSERGADHSEPVWESGGVLRWGLRESLRTYVESLPGGEIEVLDGAQRLASGAFAFPLSPASAGQDDLDKPLDFDGAVRLTGYNGLMRIEFAQPRLESDGELVTLSVLDSLDEALAERIPFATSLASSLWLTGPTRRTANAVNLTSAGAALLGDVYTEGSLMDSWTMTLFTR